MAPRTNVTRKELELVRDTISRYHPFIYRLAFRMLRNPADAEDLTQSVFLQLLHDPAVFSKVSHPRAWLAQMTLHMAINWVRSESRRRRREQTWATGRLQQKTGEGRVMKNTSALDEALSSLPNELRIPIILHFQEGMKYREIAEICKCPEGTVAKRISTAKARLKKRLKMSGLLALYPHLESAIKAEPSIQVPPGLEGRLFRGVEREFLQMTASQPVVIKKLALWGKILGAKNGIIAFLLSVFFLSGIWLAVERDRRPDRALPGLAGGISFSRDLPERQHPGARKALPEAPAEGEGPAARENPSGEAGFAVEGESPPEPVLFGWIWDEKGRPIEGATVAVMGQNHEFLETRTATDENGYYEISNLQGRENHDFFATVYGVSQNPGEGNFIAIDKGIRFLEVWASDPAKSAEEANVIYSSSFALETLLHLLGGQKHLAVYREEYQLEISPPLGLEDGEQLQVDFTLMKARSLTGLVISESGEPIQGADVRVVGHTGEWLLPGQLARTETDGSGLFRFASLVTGTYALRASAPGFQPVERVVRTGKSSAVFRLPSAGSVRVKVIRRETGDLLEGFRVDLRQGRWTVATAMSDKNGEIRLVNIRPGIYLLNAYREHSRSRYSRAQAEVKVTARQERQVELKLEFMASLHGKILPPGGELPSGLQVIAALDDGIEKSPEQLKRAEVKEDGSFRFHHLPPGLYVLLIMSSERKTGDGVLALAELDIHPGEREVEVEILLEPTPPGILKLRVLDSAGNPLHLATATLTRAGLGILAGSGNVGESGMVELQAFPGIFDLKVQARNHRTEIVEGITLWPGGEKELPVWLQDQPYRLEVQGDLDSFFAGNRPIAIQESMTLQTFLDLISELQLGKLVLGPGVEGCGFLEHVHLHGSGIEAPQRFLKNALQHHGLRWMLWDGRLWVNTAD